MFLKNNEQRRSQIIIGLALIMAGIYLMILLGMLVDIKYLLDDRIGEIGTDASEAMYRGVYLSGILFLSQTVLFLVSYFLIVRKLYKKQNK